MENKTMQMEIRALYKQVEEEYADQHIDDYDAFVRSRVIEHLINHDYMSADRAIALVEGLSFDDPGEPDGAGASEGKTSRTKAIVEITKTVLPYVLTTAAVAISLRLLLKKKKKK